MRGMILAAGRGTRMGKLTADTPKPLLKINNTYLIEYAINSLIKLNIKEIVINISYHAEKIKSALGDGKKYKVDIHYSYEKEPLETGGGIYQALPILGPEPFVVISSDIVTHYSIDEKFKSPEDLAHLVLVDNPIYHPAGDFCLKEGKVFLGEDNPLTFANIGFYKPELFANCKAGKYTLASVLKEAIKHNKVTGEHFKGLWHNLGTPHDLEFLNLLSLPSSPA